MVGRELENEFPRVNLQRGDEILRIENLNAGMLRNVHLTLYRGEILGLGGLVGSGRSELARAIFGADPREAGEILLEGKPIHPRSPREAIDLGIGLLTEDRNKYGLIMQMNIRENLSLSNLREVLSGLFISRTKENAVARRYADNLRIKTLSIEQEVEALSGGNRQKVVLARWLFTQSKVLIFDEPTAGIDVGVKYEIYSLINNLAQKGIGVMVISSELPELLGICSRIAVMHEGRLMEVLDHDEATQERIMTLATGGHQDVV
jgi:ribose transport system ATP-binding protein